MGETPHCPHIPRCGRLCRRLVAICGTANRPYGKDEESVDTRREIEGLIALSPWIVFLLLIALSQIWEFRDKRREARASRAEDIAELPRARRST